MNQLRLEYLDPSQLADHPANWKFHPEDQLQGLDDFISRVGWAGALTYNEQTQRLLDGHGRKQKFAGKGPVPVLIGSWDEDTEKEILAFLDPTGWPAIADKRKLDALLGDGFPALQSAALNGLLDAVKASAKLLDEPGPNGDSAREDDQTEVVVPLDSIWPSDNSFDVPSLLPNLAADQVPHPVMTWGSVGHSRPMPGTWHFYTADAKFEPLWRRPQRVLRSRPHSVVEPNFSTTDQTPLAQAIWHVYRKRWLARYWQQCGLRVFVDLNCDAALNALLPGLDIRPNLLGVPRGWPAYASRAHSNQPETLLAEWAVSRDWAGAEAPLFLVVGGGRQVKQLSKEHGWVWVPEQIQQVHGVGVES